MSSRRQPSLAPSLPLTSPGPHATGDVIEPFFPGRVPAWKRLMDVVGAAGMIVLLLPVFAAVALLIKAVSRGPVIYRQERIGLGGTRFRFLKFRTMQVKSSDTSHRRYLQRLIAGAPVPMHKLDAANPDIIPLGRFLRSTCLDELPQLVNVLRGEMSLVGPRPPVLYEAAAYAPWHSTRFACLPGMTGLWQISGKNRLSFPEMIRLDIRYARSMSVWSDVRILISTPFAIARDFMWQPQADASLAGEKGGRP